MALRRGNVSIPSKQKQLILTEFGPISEYRRISQVAEAEVPTPGPKELLVRTRYVGIQAGEILSITGFNLGGTPEPLPSLTGHEGIGEVVAVGSETKTKVGQVVTYVIMVKGANREYSVIPESSCLVVPEVDPAYLAFVGSGLTASIVFEKECDLKSGQTVLVTAAAGATGNFAVQLAKLEGCHVIGTCSTHEKVKYLKSIGCDRPVNYKEESLDDVLTKEYPNGVDVVYETVGKQMFDIALKHLAVRGRLLVIGSTAEYTSSPDDKSQDSKENPPTPIPWMLLAKSASMRGYMSLHYENDFQRHMEQLTKLYKQGKLKVKLETYTGLGSCVDALESLYAGKNIGKLVVKV